MERAAGDQNGFVLEVKRRPLRQMKGTASPQRSVVTLGPEGPTPSIPGDLWLPEGP